MSTDGPALSSQYNGGSGIGRITPLVYNPESDGPPVFHSGVWTGDDERVQFVQTADTGNQGTDEGDTSQSDDKSRARSWWGIRGWFLGDEPIDDGGAQVVQTVDGGRGQQKVGTGAGDWLDKNFGGGTWGEPDLSGRVWAGFRGLFSVAPIAGEISDGHELIVGVGPNGEKLTPGQRGATAVGAMIPFVPGGVARRVLGPVTDVVDEVLEVAASRRLMTPLEFGALPRTGTIDPKTIRYSQDSISPTFKNDGGDVADLAKALKDGKIDPASIPPIRIVEKDGMIFTLDNRRLKAFQEAGVPISYTIIDGIPKKDQFKFTTKNDGVEIDVR